MSKLNEEEYKQFKVALRNFHEAKKNGDNDKKVKYYKALRILFANDLTLFAEVENFIQYKGVIKPSSLSTGSGTAATSIRYDNSTPTKRKLDERN